MYGQSGNSRSRYDYYYSMSSPSLSRAVNYFENHHGSLFGDPVLPLSQGQKTLESSQTISNQLPMPAAPSKSAGSSSNFIGSAPLIENFDQHLYESIRQNIMDYQNNNVNMQATANALSNKLMWTQQSISQTPTPPLFSEDFDKKRKRSGSACYGYNNKSRQSKHRAFLARSGSLRNFQTSSEDSVIQSKSTIFYHNNRPVTPKKRTTSLASSSKYTHSISHSAKSNVQTNIRPHVFSKSVSNVSQLKTYPEAFTIMPVTTLQKIPIIKPCQMIHQMAKNLEDDDEMMQMDWLRPPPEKLLEAAKVVGDRDLMLVHPSSPIIVDNIKIGSQNRLDTLTPRSHKKMAFAIVNDNNNKVRKLQHRHSEDNLSGRFSPYSKYVLQREYGFIRPFSPLSAPALNVNEHESQEEELFTDYMNVNDERGRQTSIGFVHNRLFKNSSMINLTLKQHRPLSEHPFRGYLVVGGEKSRKRNSVQYRSVPNFMRMNKISLAKPEPQAQQSFFLNPQRKQKGVLKVYNNTNIQRRTFSLGNLNLEGAEYDTAQVAPMPINMDSKRSRKLKLFQQQQKAKLLLKKRKLSPIAGTPNKADAKKPKEKPKFGQALKKPKPIPVKSPKVVRKPPLPFGKSAKSPAKKLPAEPKKQTLKDSDFSFAHPPPTTPARPNLANDIASQLAVRNLLSKTLKSKSEQPKPLIKQPSKQSIDSIMGDEIIKPPLKKKNSFTSIRSISNSIRTIASLRSNKSNSIEDEAAEAADEVTKLNDVNSHLKKKLKSSMNKLNMTKSLAKPRVGSASQTAKQQQILERQPSKTSLLSVKSTKSSSKDPQPQETPSRDINMVPFSNKKTNIVSMTTAAITAQPLQVTQTITNLLAYQGQAILAAESANSETVSNTGTIAKTNVVKPESRTESRVGSHHERQQPDNQSVSSVRTLCSVRTMASHKVAQTRIISATKKPTVASRQPSAISRQTSAMSRQASDLSRAPSSKGTSPFVRVVYAKNAVKTLAKKQRSNLSMNSIKSDATHITLGPGSGMENYDCPTPTIPNKLLLEHSQKTLENVQQTVSNATDQINKTINANLSDLRTLENKMLTKSQMLDEYRNLMQQDANNNDEIITIHGHESGTDKIRIDMQLQNPDYVDDNNSNQMGSSSSMQEHKRRICCGLSSCCSQPDDVLMIDNAKLSCCQKMSKCCCLPFQSSCKPCRRKKVTQLTSEQRDTIKTSIWRKICCCSSCCKKQDKSTQPSQPGCFKNCLGRLNCFKCCKPCCSRMSCCSCCKRKTLSTTSLQTTPMKKSGLCARIFCCCCARGRHIQKETNESIISDSKNKPNCCSRMFQKLLCCKKKEDVDSRRTSMLSKKQSLAPTIPPPEDTKPKLDMMLVEHASLMKGAIPVLPVCLSWFCLVFNVFLPGTGTVFSGFFCLCLGIPRFSQHDSARGRIGSFVINCIVGVSQSFTIIFCLVGWGWSIWWGTTMLSLAKKHKKIKDAENKANRMVEQTTTSTKSSQPATMQRTANKNQDVEAGLK